MNVYQKLNEARQRFHVAKISKSGRNEFAKYNYFELADFVIPALAIFSEVGLCAMVSFEADMATMRIVDVDKPEDVITITSPMGSASLKGCHEVQNIGAVETYQRRYLWTAAMEIIEHDALEAATGDKSRAPKVNEKPRGQSTLAAAAEDDPVPEEERPYLDELAMDMTDAFQKEGAEAAYDLMASKGLENNHKLYLSMRLASNVRNAVKKVSIDRRAVSV